MTTFELTAETRVLDDGTRVYRIRCTHPIPGREGVPPVDVGDLGGWVQSAEVTTTDEEDGTRATHNRLCGNAWVAAEACVIGDAVLCENARVSGTATVRDGAWVHGDAGVEGSAVVGDDASVSGDAKVAGAATIGGSAQVSDSARVDGNATVSGDAEVRGHSHVTGHATIGGEGLVIDHARVGGRSQVREHASVAGHAQLGGDAVLAGNTRLSGNAIAADCARISATVEITSSICIRGHAAVERSDHLLVIQSFGKDQKPVAIFRSGDTAEVNFGLDECITTTLEDFPGRAERMIRAAETSEAQRDAWRGRIAAITTLAEVTIASWALPEHKRLPALGLHGALPDHRREARTDCAE